VPALPVVTGPRHISAPRGNSGPPIGSALDIRDALGGGEGTPGQGSCSRAWDEKKEMTTSTSFKNNPLNNINIVMVGYGRLRY